MSDHHHVYEHIHGAINGEFLNCCDAETAMAITIGLALFAISTICAPFLSQQPEDSR